MLFFSSNLAFNSNNIVTDIICAAIDADITERLKYYHNNTPNIYSK